MMIDFIMFVLYVISAISVVIIGIVFFSLGATAVVGLAYRTIEWLKGLIP
jgi:hypothetical protein